MQFHVPVEAPAHPLMTAVYPRFTPQEVLILNLVVNSYPGYISSREIIRQLVQTLAPSPHGGPTLLSLQVAICGIRAKLGEKKWKPSKLVTIYELTNTGKRGHLLGYAWRG